MNPIMRSRFRKCAIFLFVLSVTFTSTVVAQNMAINTTGNNPDVSAMLDVVSSNKGMLLPRVSLASTSDATTIPTPATSLLVYNTNAGITGTHADGVGYYYNNGTSGSPEWVKLNTFGVRWDDLRITLDRGKDATAISYFSGSTGPEIWYFRNNSQLEAMSFTVQLPHTWKEGSDIFPHLHWSPKASKAGNVEWKLEYTWQNYDPVTPQVFPAITTNTVVSTGPFTAKTHLITSLTPGNAGIDGTGKKISSILICRLTRNSSNTADTYNDDAGLFVPGFPHYGRCIWQ
jgi:hypothetical protein